MSRTKTYIAADWDSDRDAVEKLLDWNNNRNLGLSFNYAHDIQQARDNSLKCSIKRSLADRMNVSKTFVLIVGANTKSVRNGSCQYCNSKNSYTGHCARGNRIDNRSYIEFECEKAVNDRLNIVVLYKSTIVNKFRCPDSVKNIGIHIPLYFKDGLKTYWNYERIKNVLNNF